MGYPGIRPHDTVDDVSLVELAVRLLCGRITHLSSPRGVQSQGNQRLPQGRRGTRRDEEPGHAGLDDLSAAPNVGGDNG